MSLKDQITEDMKTAMRAKDSERLGTIRLLLAAMKQKEVDERVVLDDAAVVAIVDKLVKQRETGTQPLQAPADNSPHVRDLPLSTRVAPLLLHLTHPVLPRCRRKLAL